jgi:DNA-binding NtrC family response regulator
MKSKRVLLLLEDDSATRYVLGAILRGMGSEYEVISEVSTHAAVAALGTRHIDLLITDLVLGADNGVEITRRARQQYPHLAVIWITGFGCQHFAEQAEELGVYSCLDKPAPASLVRRMVRQALEDDGRAAGGSDRLSKKAMSNDE